MRFGSQSQYPNLFGSDSLQGAHLEHVILSNSKEFYKETIQKQVTSNAAREKWKLAAQTAGKEAMHKKLDTALPEDDTDENCCNKKFCWWTPSQDSIPVAFCNETSIHGVLFLGQAKRHLTERIFWLVAFIASLSTAIYLIYGVWERYQRIPVIVSFQSKEQDIDSIPFPAVTLCNMNKFPKKKVKELETIARLPSHPEHELAKQRLTFVRSVCSSQISFAKEFGYAHSRGRTEKSQNANDTITEDAQDDMMDFLLEYTIPCEELIHLCIFGEHQLPCRELFKPIITDYGKCCTFNILPLPLLLKNPQNIDNPAASIYDNPALGTKKFWNEDEIELWKKWNYDDGFVLTNEKRPWRQKRAGMPYGMSILMDPNTEEYFCPVSDSEGMRYILHTPLEMPHVMEFASIADLGKEILIEVHPDMTNADDDLRDFDHKKRECYYGKEKTLRFFGPYTGGNCVDECTSLVLAKKCKCTFFFMPRDDGVRICNNDIDSADRVCVDQARVHLQETLKEECGHCDTLCEDIAYNYETTIATLQDASGLWLDPHSKYHNATPSWANHKMSVVHIFFGSETTVPKLRKRLYGTTDLIANTGGILGLCLGFSVLSGVEVFYFMTLRAFWKYCRKRRIGRSVANKFTKMFTSRDNRVIRVNPNLIPVYPAYPHGGGEGGRNGHPYFGNGMQFGSNVYNRSPYPNNMSQY